MLRLGVDVGGTNTDAVLLRGDTVVGSAKRVTSADRLSGIQNAVQSAIAGCSADCAAVAACMLGTTQFVNACVQRRGLTQVMVFRLCGPATHALPPFCDIPTDLGNTLRGQYRLLDGGYEFDGGTEISPLSKEQIHKATDKALKAGYTSLVVSGVFSPVNSSQEEAAADIINKHAGVHYAGTDRMQVNMSHEFTELGLLERENAAILNACLRPLADHLLPNFEKAFRGLGLPGALYLTSNDGTLMSSEQAQRLPLHTFQSGPVNSLRGAAKLSGLSDGIVVDIGGTTTDVGVLQQGFPLPASREALLAGVRINQRVPNILSIGLGGGSVVKWTNGTCTVGPDSVASQLTSRALVFGGGVCTATDVAVRLGRLNLGQPHLTSGLSTSDAQQAWDTMQSMLTQCIDQVKTSAEAVPVIVVGGGAGLCGDALEGAACIVKPSHADVANAVGAAIPQVSGTVDGVFQMGSEGQKRTAYLAEAQASAHAKAVQAGADPSTCKVMAVDEIPLAYLPGGVVRLHVKVVGDLQIAAPPAPSTKPSTSEKKSDLQKPHQPALQKQDAQQRRKLPEQQPGAPRTPQQQSPIGKTLTVPDSGSPVPETHQHSEPQDPDPSELQRLDPSDPHYSDPSKAQPDPYGPHHQSPSLPHPDPYEPNDLDLSKAHHPEPSSQALVSQPDHMTSAVPGNEAAGKLQTTNVTSFAPDLSSAASELHHPRPSDPHRPHPFATHQPTPSDPHHPNPSQDCLTAVSTSAASPAHTASAISSSEADLAPLSPRELSQSGGSMGATTAGWVITKTHVEALAIGCGILGSGGGGSPYRAKLKRLKEGAKIRVIPCSAVPDDAYVVDASYMGAPTVSIEKLDSSQAEAAAHAVLKAVGKEAFAIVAGEIGGGNGLEALNVAASMNLPVVDADFMGRAFPELQMMTTAIYGVPIAPAALADEKGNAVVVQTVANIHSLEHILRPVCTAMGCSAGFASAPVSGKQLRAVAIQGSLSLALTLGLAVQQAQRRKADPVAAAATAGNGNLIFKGKVTDIERSTTDGFARGVLRLSGLDHWCHQQADIHFQNENLLLRIDGKVSAIVPDLICCLDIYSGHSVATEELCYGLRLSVVRLPADAKLLTPEALEIVGPQAFGFEDLHLASLQNSRTAA
ncbi:hypothetical protein ABBQ32_011184 [Trebouxia sp. C0010 RCD-2024]